MEELWRNIFKANTVAEVDDLMRSTAGPSGLIEFLRFNHGDIVHKGKMGGMPGIIRLVVGNPGIMRRMAEHVPDAGSYLDIEKYELWAYPRQQSVCGNAKLWNLAVVEAVGTWSAVVSTPSPSTP